MRNEGLATSYMGEGVVQPQTPLSVDDRVVVANYCYLRRVVETSLKLRGSIVVTTYR